MLEKKEYTKIITNPYLVSALYYSDNALKEICSDNPKKSTQYQIITEIRPFINKNIREKYLEVLATLCDKPDNKEKPPLKILNYSKDLHKNHLDAIDLFIEEGSNIQALTGGIVVLAENKWNKKDKLSTSSAKGGNTVIIYKPSKKEFYRYAHLKKVYVKSGTIVKSGQTLGTVGNTGENASKPGHGKHLHFEINKYDASKKIMVSLSVYELKDRLTKL